MTTHAKTFYKVTCDGKTSDEKPCPAVLTDGESPYWDAKSIASWLKEDEWIEWQGADLSQHYCLDHWTYCDSCDEKTPTHLLVDVNDDGERVCPRCDPRPIEMRDHGNDE